MYVSQGQVEGAEAPSRIPSIPPRLFVSNDPRETVGYLQTHFPDHRFRLRPGTDMFTARFASAGDARLQLQTSSITGHLEGTAPWSKDYVLQWFRSGSLRLDYPQGPAVSVGTRPLIAPTETALSFTITPHSRSVVQIDSDFLETVAARRHGGHPQRIVFDLDAAPSDIALEAWQVRIRDTSRILRDTASPASKRLAAQTAVVNGILDSFPWAAVDVPERVRTERTVHLRRAVEYTHAHTRQPITSADVANAVGMHLRTLQKASQEHLGMSPNKYLRCVRLDQAHHDLTYGVHKGTTVADVARRLRLGHLGRFATNYRERFGEHPYDTLLR